MASKKEISLIAAWTGIGVFAATFVAGWAGFDFFWTAVVAGVSAFAFASWAQTH